MSTTETPDETNTPSDDAPIETLREFEGALSRLAETDLPIAPYAQNAIARLEEADTDA